MLSPGKNYYGSPMRVETCFEDSTGTLVDPDTVTFKTMSPSGTETSYVYLTDTEIGRSSSGIYYCDFTPNASGRWHYRWESTGDGLSVAHEGSFVIQRSAFYEGQPQAYRDY
jgi:hypothetical protein